MRWLVTGGCGFVGTNLVHALLSKGEEVVILDNLQRHGSRANRAWLLQSFPSCRVDESDVRDAHAVEKLIADYQPEAIAHLAGQVAMTTSLADPRADFDINAGGTLNVLEAVRLRAPGAIVLYSSTNKVYGSLDGLHYDETPTRYRVPSHPRGFDERLQLDGSSPYGCSKLSAEQYVRDYFRMFDVRTVVFRHSSIYGEHQFATYDQGWVGWFCAKAIEQRQARSAFTISGNGKQVRDVIHASDLVSAYFAAVANIERSAGEVFNLGGGMENSLSLLELFGRLEAMTGLPMPFEELPARKADQKVFVADNGKASTMFGWRPMVNVDAGLKRMVQWTVSVAGDRPTRS